MIAQLSKAGLVPPDPGHDGALGRRQRRAAREQKLFTASVLYGALALTGWLATTALIVGGVFVALFAAAGNGTLAGFFEQLDLLARHYLTADPLRRGEFDGQLLIAAGIAFFVAAFFRRASLMSIFWGGTDGPTISN
jgi:hypothetical protein